MSPFWIILIAFIALGIISSIVGAAREKKRTAKWQEVASQPGMQFLGERCDVQSRFARLKFFQVGRNRNVKNAIQVDSGALRITVADYKYRTGSGKNKHTHRRTFCILESESLNTPHCILRPESRLFDAIGSLFGGQDIDFAEDPEFSSAYVLQGDETKIRELFDADVRAWFTERRGQKFHFEAVGPVLLFHQGRRLDPEQAPALMDQAIQIMKRLARTS